MTFDSDVLSRYFKGLMVSMIVVLMLSGTVERLYFQSVPDNWIVDYQKIEPAETVFTGSNAFLQSTSAYYVSAPAVWYDTLWCEGLDRGPSRLGTQDWHGKTHRNPMQTSSPWELSFHAIPDWATACHIEGEICLDFALGFNRCIEYRSEKFEVRKSS